MRRACALGRRLGLQSPRLDIAHGDVGTHALGAEWRSQARCGTRRTVKHAMGRVLCCLC